MTPNEVRALLPYLSKAEREELFTILGTDTAVWRPLPGPQSMAYHSTASVVGFGGAAGGGKTDLAIGKALTQHQVVQFFRREGTELNGIIDRMSEILGHRNGLGGKPPLWRDPSEKCRLVEFGSVPNLGDERKYQGRAKDLLIIDEAANFLLSQVRFLMGWVRTVSPGQRTQTLMTFNPPTSAEGRWVLDYFAPWLDEKHLVPALPGEIRYFVVLEGAEIEWPDGEPFEHKGEMITPQSRTFIPSRITDNPFLVGTGYMAQLQSLPEPLRSQMLYGDFKAGMEDSPWQVVPTSWVEAAQARWKPRDSKPPMESMGVDVARGGKDNTIIFRRHVDWWFDEPLVYKGSQTPDGPSVAGVTMAAMRDGAPIHIDVIGVGASPYDFLRQAGLDVFGINVAESTNERDRSGRLGFVNVRSWLWWRMREMLDPANNFGAALPPDRQLLTDLTAPKWELSAGKIKVESREDIIERIGRSPDWASALALATLETPKRKSIVRGGVLDDQGRGHDPYAFLTQEN